MIQVTSFINSANKSNYCNPSTLLLIFLYTSVIMLFSSCGSNEKPQQQQFNEKEVKESLEYANRYLIRTEAQEIDGFLSRHKWPVTTSPSGLKYWIYEKGDGKEVKNGQTLVLNYELKLLNGRKIYNSKEDGQKIFVKGYLTGEPGLDEATSYMRQGDKARIIAPAHLGFGILGDKNRIPPRATLIYDIEIAEIRELK